jgi:hypothetical protein
MQTRMATGITRALRLAFRRTWRGTYPSPPPADGGRTRSISPRPGAGSGFGVCCAVAGPVRACLAYSGRASHGSSLRAWRGASRPS